MLRVHPASHRLRLRHHVHLPQQVHAKRDTNAATNAHARARNSQIRPKSGAGTLLHQARALIALAIAPEPLP